MLKTLTLLDMLRMLRVCSFLFFLFVELVGFLDGKFYGVGGKSGMGWDERGTS
jgi:hypothetical protein